MYGVVVLKKKSLTRKILFLVLFTVSFVCILITCIGTHLIYTATKSGIESEVTEAAGTLQKLFEREFPGDFVCDGFIYNFGGQAVCSEDFYEIIGCFEASEDMEYTVFFADKRVFTTVVNPNGSSAAGTFAAENVVNDVLLNGKSHIYDNVDVNGIAYMGYYSPIFNSDGKAAGMFFAGKPMSLAVSNAKNGSMKFILISLITLIISLTVCTCITEKMVKDLGDIEQYIDKISNGNFNARMKEKTLHRSDEIGDIGKNAEKLCTNLRDMVERDPLTALLNRRSCMMKLNELTENSMLYTVVMGDIDFFKRINDTYGHVGGDYILKEVSSVLKRYAEENDAFVSRWGGEEFLMIFRSRSGEEAYAVVDKILEEIRSAEYEYKGRTISFTMTFGISQVRSGDNAENVINRADVLLYKGKQSGRNRIVI